MFETIALKKGWSLKAQVAVLLAYIDSKLSSDNFINYLEDSPTNPLLQEDTLPLTSMPIYYRVQAKMGQQAALNEYFFNKPEDADALRFHIALDWATDQGVLGELAENVLGDSALLQTADEEILRHALKRSPASKYDEIVDQVIEILSADEVITCQLSVDTIEPKLLKAGKLKLEALRE